MLKFNIITIFPEIFNGFLSESLIKKAGDKKIIGINTLDLRKFTNDPHKTVDDKPFGGGRGMVLKVEPVFKAVSSLKEKNKVIVFSPRGKKFDQKKAYQLSKLKNIVLICGRYEGIDERIVDNIADEIISIGDYVLMGGEVPAMVLMEAVIRLVPGVLGNSELLKDRMPTIPGKKEKGFTEFPQYTRPEVFIPQKGLKWSVPKILLSGDHKKIEEWRKKHLQVIE